jgi:hypothetical protein
MLSKSVNNDAAADEALAAITAFIAECNDDVIGTGREWKCGVCSKQVSLATARTGCWPELQARRWLQGQITNHCKSGGHNQAKQQSLAPAKNTTLLGLWGRAAPPSGTSASGAGASAGGPGLAPAPQPAVAAAAEQPAGAGLEAQAEAAAVPPVAALVQGPQQDVVLEAASLAEAGAIADHMLVLAGTNDAKLGTMCGFCGSSEQHSGGTCALTICDGVVHSRCELAATGRAKEDGFRSTLKQGCTKDLVACPEPHCSAGLFKYALAHHLRAVHG